MYGISQIDLPLNVLYSASCYLKRTRRNKLYQNRTLNNIFKSALFTLTVLSLPCTKTVYLQSVELHYVVIMIRR